jgi:probable F420-dependent oxidoreductase
MDLGRVGIWSSYFRSSEDGPVRDAAAELDTLGFGALWIPGGAGGPIFDEVARVLAVTERLVVATGILNIWMHDPGEVAASHHRLSGEAPGRFLLGLGVSHAPLVDARSGRHYERPLEVMSAYLDDLDAAPTPVPPDERALAALGPKMLELAAGRSAGAHPYLVSPEHTAFARKVLGPGPLLAPEQKVLLVTDPVEARARARETVALYLRLPNYVRNLRRIGYSEDDVSGGGSDRLIDGLVAWGDLGTIVERVREHLDAGADHVCLQVLAPGPDAPLAEWRELGSALPSL